MTDQSAMARALMKDPEWEYGEILPMATRKGEREWAIPDVLRAPMQSWVKIMDSMGTGQIQTREGTEELMPDILNVTPMGGATARASNAMRRAGFSDDTKMLPYHLNYARAYTKDALAPFTERLQQRRERVRQPPPPVRQEIQEARPQIDPGRRVAPPPEPPKRSADVDGILAEIEELSKMIAQQNERLAANADDLSQLTYSRNRESLRQNPNSLQSRLQRGPESYSPPPDRMMPRAPDVGPLKTPKLFSGERPMSRGDVRRMQMAHGEFRASIDAPQAAFRAGKITEEQYNEIAQAAINRAARGNGIDPRYLIKQIAKDQKRDPKGWALTYPNKKD